MNLYESSQTGMKVALTYDNSMNLNIPPTKKLALLSAAFCAVMFAFNQNASAYKLPLPPSINLTIGDNHELGFVNFGIPSGDADRLAYVNHLIGMALGTQDDALGQHFTRSNNAFSPLPLAALAGHVNGIGTTIDLGSGLYTYLFAKYDGPNYGSEVWYVGNLSGIITIPATGGGYGLSGWTLFGPGVPGVPDGGTTAMLLGAALTALGMARRFLMG
jgi:VPDSG-CTERM motif